MRWLYHLVPSEIAPPESYAPASLTGEGFVHASYRDDVAQSAALHFPVGAALSVWQIDPRRLDAAVTLDETPRGPMPHIRGAVPRDAVRAVVGVEAIEGLGDRIVGHHVAFVAFEGMTLLDLVGVLDPVARIASMGFDPTFRVEVVGLSEAVWSDHGMSVRVDKVRPALDAYDLVVIPGGPGARRWQHDPETAAWLATRPPNRWTATVCTGSLVLGATGVLRGRRATTHHTAFDELAALGAEVVDDRVVESGAVTTAGGVTSGIDLGLRLVERLTDRATRDAIARQMAVVDVAAR